MRFRFAKLVMLLCVLAGAFAGVAHALDFDEEDPAPVQGEVGRVLEYEIGTHAGCLPHRLEVLSGGFPPGTQLTQTGVTSWVLEGIPTDAGDYGVWLAVRDCDNRSAEALFTFNIGQRTYSIRTTSLPPATLGSPYRAKLEAGGHPIQSEQWTVESGSLPAGLTLAADGTISGTPTAAGSSTFKVKATSVGDDGAQRVDTKELTLTVGGTYSVAMSRRIGEVGRPFSSTLSVTGAQSPVKWSATGLPAGLNISSQGVVSGTPTRSGTFAVTVHFVDANGTAADGTVPLVVRARLAIAARALPAAKAGHVFRAVVAIRGGVTPLRWTASGLPRGLTVAATGTISGKPAAKGTYHVRLRVRDALGAVASKTLLLSVR